VKYSRTNLKSSDTTFQTLIDHLRSRYNLAFVSTNKNRDGTTRKLKLDIDHARQKSQDRLVIKADGVILRREVDFEEMAPGSHARRTPHNKSLDRTLHPITAVNKP
jgi:hypothetical protein